MGRANWCKHYHGFANGDTCRAGVKYADVTLGLGTPLYSSPCLGVDGRNPLSATCGKLVLRTPEEVAAEKDEFEKRLAAIGAAREAIVLHLGGKWKKGTPGASGRIKCPACGVDDALAFSRAGYNGHIHARCSTPKCVAWME